MIRHIKGDLIKMALLGHFTHTTHGANCFCTMGSGIAPLFAKAFGADKFPYEGDEYRGTMWKLGKTDGQLITLPKAKLDDKGSVQSELWEGTFNLSVINSYTQFQPGPNAEYLAIKSCLTSIRNSMGASAHLGIPLIGCGIGGLEYEIFMDIVESVFRDWHNVTVVYFDRDVPEKYRVDGE